MKTRFILTALLVAATFTTPASANWFHNTRMNVNRYIGSAPNPKPEDVRNNVVPVVVQNDQNATPKKTDPGILTRLLGPRYKTQPQQNVAQSK